MNQNNYSFKKTITSLVLLLSAVIFFLLSHPNLIAEEGLPFFAFFIYLPLLLCIHINSIKKNLIYGFLYGALSYGLYAYWLWNSYRHFLGIVITGYALILTLVFFILKLTDLLFKKNAFIVQAFIIAAFEYLKTLGFLGLSYGVTAYSQWKNLYLIQICDIAGVYGLNLLLIFSSAILYSFIQKMLDKRKLEKIKENSKSGEKSSYTAYLSKQNNLNLYSLNSSFIMLAVWTLLFTASYLYGFYRVKDYSNYEKQKVILAQNNENSWLDGIDIYTKSIYKLMQLTQEGLEFNSDAALVVWPETSVVPDILFNYYNKNDKRRYELIHTLLDFIDSKEAAFVIGNGYTKKEDDFTSKLYNSAFVFYPQKNVIPPKPLIYSKMKLVPLSECFPYKKQLPQIYEWLLRKGLVNWTCGEEINTFTNDGLVFSCLICYEDTFPQLARQHYKNNSRCFVCLTNDSWSKSRACQNQHLSIALFRSVENRVPSVRCTTSGKSCIIDPNGKITYETEDFAERFLAGYVPLLSENQKETFYNRYGDYAGYMSIILSFLLLIIQIINCIIKKNRTK